MIQYLKAQLRNSKKIVKQIDDHRYEIEVITIGENVCVFEVSKERLSMGGLPVMGSEIYCDAYCNTEDLKSCDSKSMLVKTIISEV